MSTTSHTDPVPTTARGAALRARRGVRAQLGNWGEDVAVEHLEALGWQIVARNWACDRGEIDIVALEPGTPHTLVFVEVKCRSGLGYGDPLESITVVKQRKLHELALAWLTSHQGSVPRVRIDAVGVVRRQGAEPRIDHVRGIGR
ncbi:MAG: YraN family protein [Acidipropionibacterium acidipropionici]|nr:YraN family protein [Acidipropionibacterium acidipropionici]